MSSIPKGTLALGGLAGVALLARHLGRKWAEEKSEQKAIDEELEAAPSALFERNVEGPEAFWEDHFSGPRERLRALQLENIIRGLRFSPLKRGKRVDANMKADEDLYMSDPDKFWKVFWADNVRAERQSLSHMGKPPVEGDI